LSSSRLNRRIFLYGNLKKSCDLQPLMLPLGCRAWYNWVVAHPENDPASAVCWTIAIQQEKQKHHGIHIAWRFSCFQQVMNPGKWLQVIFQHGVIRNDGWPPNINGVGPQTSECITLLRVRRTIWLWIKTLVP
jgi:hypothetical protein